MKSIICLVCFWVASAWGQNPLIVDNDHIFQPLTVRLASEKLETIENRFGFRLVVLTFATLPSQLSLQSPAMRGWLREQLAGQGPSDLALVLCRRPAFVLTIPVSNRRPLNREQQADLSRLVSSGLETDSGDEVLFRSIHFFENTLKDRFAQPGNSEVEPVRAGFWRLFLSGLAIMLLAWLGYRSGVELSLNRRWKITKFWLQEQWGQSQTRLILFLFGWFVVAWIYSNRDLFLASQQFLPRDNRETFFTFWYVAQYLRSFGSIPNWFFSQDGGLWLATLANNLHLLLPYRLLGYAVVALTGAHPNQIYKISFLIVGQGIFLWGVYQVASQLFKSSAWALALVATALISSLGVSLFHQEQALSTLFYLPFIWWCVLLAPRRILFLPLAFSLLGCSLNNHYPQLLFGYGLVVLPFAYFFIPEFRRQLILIQTEANRFGTKLLFGLCLVGFVSGASPLIFAYRQFHSKLTSPLREQSESIEAQTFADYLRMAQRSAGIYPVYLSTYFTLQPKNDLLMEKLDSRALFATPAFLLALILLLTIDVPGRKFQLACLFSFALLSTGIYGFAPRLLWNFLPGIQLFRQWYFFVSFLNLHALFAVFSATRTGLQWRVGKRFHQPILLVLVLVLAAAMKLEHLPGMVVIPSILLILFTLIKDRLAILRASLPVFALFWILGGSLIWAQGALNDYRVAVRANNNVVKSVIDLPLDTQSADAFASFLWLDRNYAFQSQLPLIMPKGLDLSAIRRLTLYSGAYWMNNQGLLRPARLSMQFARGLFQFDLSQRPVNAHSLLFTQYNDGNWRSESNRLLSGPWHLLQIPLSKNQSSLSLSRPPSGWNFLIFLMWTPILIGLIIVARPGRFLVRIFADLPKIRATPPSQSVVQG